MNETPGLFTACQKDGDDSNEPENSEAVNRKRCRGVNLKFFFICFREEFYQQEANSFRGSESYSYFFLWRFLRRRFLRLCVAILCLFLFLPEGIA